MADKSFHSVAEVAKLLALREHSVLSLIKSGDLRAIDVSLTPGGKPRWRILPEDLDAFISHRTHQASPPRRRKASPRTNVKRYF